MPSPPYISSIRALALASVVTAAACATTEAPTASAPAARPAPAPVRLAWMPVEAREGAALADALNERLARVTVDGVARTFQAPVSLEMAQLAIECIDRTPACYAAVGRSVGADRLLWAELEHGGRGAVTVRVCLFDVGSGGVVRKAERVYASATEARGGVAALVDDAFAPRTASRSATP